MRLTKTKFVEFLHFVRKLTALQILFYAHFNLTNTLSILVWNQSRIYSGWILKHCSRRCVSWSNLHCFMDHFTRFMAPTYHTLQDAAVFRCKLLCNSKKRLPHIFLLTKCRAINIKPNFWGILQEKNILHIFFLSVCHLNPVCS